MDCDRIKDLLEAHALGALDPDEQTAVERHLAGCPDCRRLAAAYAEIAHALPHALATASHTTVPPALKRRVLASIETAPADAATGSQTAPVGRRRPTPLPQRRPCVDARPRPRRNGRRASRRRVPHLGRPPRPRP